MFHLSFHWESSEDNHWWGCYTEDGDYTWRFSGNTWNDIIHKIENANFPECIIKKLNTLHENGSLHYKRNLEFRTWEKDFDCDGNEFRINHKLMEICFG